MDLKIPKIKKSVEAFLCGEEGRITKNSIMKLGTVTLLASLAAVNEIQAGGGDHSNHTSHAQSISQVANWESKTANVCGFVHTTPNEGAAQLYHSNALVLNKQSDAFVTKHNHCADTHTSHDSHASHGSHSSCWGMSW
jgi:hypothetical protein